VISDALMGQMVDNAEEYLEEAVRASTIKPSRDPKARATFLASAVAAAAAGQAPFTIT
jgi:TetR/AcrR family transcriptional regulator, regulator of cefoperazone and chloramphenicol sensitivity